MIMANLQIQQIYQSRTDLYLLGNNSYGAVHIHMRTKSKYEPICSMTFAMSLLIHIYMEAISNQRTISKASESLLLNFMENSLQIRTAA